MKAPDPADGRVWDLPTRLFHWLLVVLVGLQYATGAYGLLDMTWHFRLGYATLALLLFRFGWGLIGSQTSRFAEFVRGPRAVWRYCRTQFSRDAPHPIGHNPLGGWSVLALLIVSAVQAVSGLFASDELADDGPLAAHVGTRTVRWMTRLHVWNQNVLLVLIAVHIAAVLGHLLYKRDDLIGPMLTGRRPGAEIPPLRFVSAWRALGVFLASAALVALLLWWAGT